MCQLPVEVYVTLYVDRLEMFMKIIVYGFINFNDSLWSGFAFWNSRKRNREAKENLNMLASQRQQRYGPNGNPGSPMPPYTEHRRSSVEVGRSNLPYIKEGPLPPSTSKPPEKYLTDEDGMLVIYHDAYLSSAANIGDLVVVVAYWIDFVLTQFQYPWCSFFKGIAAMKCFKLLYLTEGTSVSSYHRNTCFGNSCLNSFTCY
jgi:hypothetical protein